MVERGLVKFAVGQLEKGETGNIHLQYYIQRERQTTLPRSSARYVPTATGKWLGVLWHNA